MTQRFKAASLALLLAFALPASAQDDRPKWHTFADDSVAALNYAIPNSDDGDFSLVCHTQRRRVQLAVYQEIADTKVGRDIEIVLSAGGKSVSVRGKTATDEMMGFVYGKARNVTLAPVLAVLQESGELTVTMGKAKASYPEKDRRHALARFAKACKLP